MKILSTTIKILMVFLLAGALLFSCGLADADNGTLVISTENNSAREMKDIPKKDEIKSYRVTCKNEGNEIIKNFNSSTSLSLSPGTWTVTVLALDAEEKEIGSGSKDVSIIAGKTTAFPLTIWPPEFKNYSLAGLEMPEGGELIAIFEGSHKPHGDQSNNKVYGNSQNKYLCPVVSDDDIKNYGEYYNDITNKNKEGLYDIVGTEDILGNAINPVTNNRTGTFEIINHNFEKYFILVFEGVKENEYTNYLGQIISDSPYDHDGGSRDRYEYTTDGRLYILSLGFVENGGFLVILVREGPALPTPWY